MEAQKRAVSPSSQAPTEKDNGGFSDDTSSHASKDIEKGEPRLPESGEKSGNRDSNGVNLDGLVRMPTNPVSYVVKWTGPDDPENPINWPRRRKFTTTVLYSFMTLTITFASSVFSTATQVTAEYFSVSNEVMTLGTSLFVLVSPPAHPYIPYF